MNRLHAIPRDPIGHPVGQHRHRCLVELFKRGPISCLVLPDHPLGQLDCRLAALECITMLAHQRISASARRSLPPPRDTPYRNGRHQPFVHGLASPRKAAHSIPAPRSSTTARRCPRYSPHSQKTGIVWHVARDVEKQAGDRIRWPRFPVMHQLSPWQTFC